VEGKRGGSPPSVSSLANASILPFGSSLSKDTSLNVIFRLGSFVLISARACSGGGNAQMMRRWSCGCEESDSPPIVSGLLWNRDTRKETSLTPRRIRIAPVRLVVR